ncbi:unnamed protein product [Arabis nemorensis]|uniref:Uncharacterized protein n=1 Tax=Arabis nemorensis TaxID=586526 RepID=A0A565BGW5_9BRAS|nr:unnamed protein product [Arabis nemorensis]
MGAIVELLAQAPLIKEIVDHYSAPDSSNPGWGCDKKYNFMDKFVLDAELQAENSEFRVFFFKSV